jgi:rRNA maturation RNase YbeY
MAFCCEFWSNQLDGMQKVKFHYADAQFNYNKKTALKTFVETVFKKEKYPLEELNYIFCSDAYLLQINQAHLKHNTYTDIITFDLSADRSFGIIGEIYISIDRVKENAQTFQTPFITELSRVIFHGALHLCGYKDKKQEDAQLMRKMEEKYLKDYF